ncbi:CAP domain-containing protein [Nocardia sp. NBC_01499]|uniref:CAP domain-containing protein n=1 Tax=Nocardia sp. NBC_01499 TaxID=2903597 RepID=UPI0038659D3D
MLSFSTAVGISAFALTVAGAPAALAAPQSTSTADEVVSLTNNERAKAGCSPLKAESHLTQAAQGHSEDMAAGGFMDHNSSKGDPGDRISAAGYHAQTWAENIAAGQRSASEVVSSWMNSAGHRANILNCGLKDIGVGYAKAGNGTAYWTQDFGTSDGQGDEQPAEPGGKPGKPGGDTGKPGGDTGKPGGDTGKPGKPGGGSPWDPWNPDDGSGDNGGDPGGDGSDDNSDNGGDSPWDQWGDGSDPGNGGDSWNPWGNWNPWGAADSKPGNTGDASWDPWSNGFDKPSSNGGDSPFGGAWGQEFDDLLGQLAGKGGW